MADVTQQQVIDYIKGISVVELSELVKVLEKELGVSAAAAMPVAMPGMLAPGGAGCGCRGANRVHGDAYRHRRQEDQRDQGRT